MIDTHSHLFDEAFDIDREDVIKRAKLCLDKIIIVGFSSETNKQALALTQKYPKFMFPTVGLHPEVANLCDENALFELEMLIKNNKVYAIGECGLDYHWIKDNKEKQKWLFEAQIRLAIKYNLPLIIHCRDAINDTYEMLLKYKGQVRFVMHCYSGSKEMAIQFLKIGAYFGIGGVLTFKNAKEIKEVVKIIPLDHLLIETDCPYLAPTPYRGKRNESSYVLYVLNELAAILGQDVKEVERILDYNSNTFFNLI